MRAGSRSPPLLRAQPVSVPAPTTSHPQPCNPQPSPHPRPPSPFLPVLGPCQPLPMQCLLPAGTFQNWATGHPGTGPHEGPQGHPLLFLSSLRAGETQLHPVRSRACPAIHGDSGLSHAWKGTACGPLHGFVWTKGEGGMPPAPMLLKIPAPPSSSNLAEKWDGGGFIISKTYEKAKPPSCLRPL